MCMRSCVTAAGIIIALATTSAVAEPPLPEFYGLYAIAEGKLYSLDTADPALAGRAQSLRLGRTEKEFAAGGGPSIPVPFLPASLNFLVYVKGNALQAASQLSLRQLPFIRTMIINANDPNWRRTYQVNTWVSTTEFVYANVGASTIDLRFKPVRGQDEMVIAVPSTPLSPGLYRLGENFVFAIPPLESAASARCIDAIHSTTAWRIVPCSEVPPSAATPTPSIKDSPLPTPDVELGMGFEVTGVDVPVFSSAEGSEIKTRLPKGTVCANAKGHSLGTPNEFRLEEKSGRIHVVYLQDMRSMKEGWVESRSLVRFAYECSCSPARCSPINFSLSKHTWNDCFEKALRTRSSGP